MNVTILAKAVYDGIVSVPVDFYYGLERTFQDMRLSDGRSRTQQLNFSDDRRVYRAVQNLITDRSAIGKIAVIIIEDSLKNLPEETLQKIYDEVVGLSVMLTSRTALQIAISSALGAKVVNGLAGSILTRISMRTITGTLTGGIVLQGVIARACIASRQLRIKNPALWQQLYMNDYDMLYFLFEEPLKYYIEMGDILKNNPAKTTEFLHALENR